MRSTPKWSSTAYVESRHRRGYIVVISRLIVCIMIGTILYRFTIAEGSKDYLFIYFCIVVLHEEVSR